MSPSPIPEDQQITLTWSTREVIEYTHEFTYGWLRDAVNAERAREGQPPVAGPDISGELGYLEHSWLADYEDEDDGGLGTFRRQISQIPAELRVPSLREFTVTLSGSEREDGEAPFTYVLYAQTLDDARALAVAFHVTDGTDLDTAVGWSQAAADIQIVDGPYDTFAGAPSWPADLPGRGWNDLRHNARLRTAAYHLIDQRAEST